MSKSPFLVVHHFVFPCVFVESSGYVPEAFRLKFDAVVFAEILFSLVLCVSSALQSKIAECLSLTKVHQYT